MFVYISASIPLCLYLYSYTSYLNRPLSLSLLCVCVCSHPPWRWEDLMASKMPKVPWSSMALAMAYFANVVSFEALPQHDRVFLSVTAFCWLGGRKNSPQGSTPLEIITPNAARLRDLKSTAPWILSEVCALRAWEILCISRAWRHFHMRRITSGSSRRPAVSGIVYVCGCS